MPAGFVAVAVRQRKDSAVIASDCSPTLTSFADSRADDINRIHKAAGRLAERFPGKRLGELFQSILDTAPPNSPVVVNALLGIAQFRAISASLLLDHAKLNRNIASEFAELVKSCPAEICEFLRGQGWIVTLPPSNAVTHPKSE